MVDETRTFGAPDASEPAEQYQAPAQAAASLTLDAGLLDQLQQDAHQELEQEVKLRVSARPGWVLGFNSTIHQQQIRSWEQRSSRGKGQARNVDTVKQSGLMLVEQSTGVYREQPDGSLQQVMDPEGDPLTLTAYAWLDLYQDAGRDSLAVLRRFAGDSGVLALGQALINASGWGDAADQIEDPTGD